MANKRKNRRRQVIVDPGLQSRMIFAASWPPCLGMCGATLLLGVFCTRLHGEALAADVDLPSIVPVFGVSVAFMVAAACFVVFAARRLSHRVAGPAINIGKTLQRYRAGDASVRIRLRRGDYLCDVASNINGLLDWIEDPDYYEASDMSSEYFDDEDPPASTDDEVTATDDDLAPVDDEVGHVPTSAPRG